MYHHLIQIQDPSKRVQVIQTCLASMEYIQSAKRAGLYSHLLHYMSVVQSGHLPSPLPGESQNTATSGAGGGAGAGAGGAGGAGLQHPRMAGSHPSMGSSAGIGATHPSMIRGHGNQSHGNQSHGNQSHGNQSQQIQTYADTTPSWKVVTDTSKQKAISYFSSCLEVLGIQEEVALTEESLKKAYKRMAVKAHPDKGGSEEYFEAVTRAYAYLTEILRYMRGGRDGTASTDRASVQAQRTQEAKQWEFQGDPVRLNPNKLDMNTFNTMFEKTHLADPDADGYGDWLKDDGKGAGGGAGGAGAGGQKFKGEFNRDVFNRMFEDESKKTQRSGNQLIVHPGEMALTLCPSSGTDLVAERPSSFTAAANSRFQYTDLRGAYTSDATISDKVSNVTVGTRNIEEYRASRERAPDPLSETELYGIRDFEQRLKLQDSTRERKRAEMAVQNQDYFNRMKQLVITDGAKNLNSGNLALPY